ncbi:pectate lyase [Ralstonia pseudosolanacearum]|uniref:pectate lyase n=1 Tax=Ralstonia pseudosolanacearum TaxID=1310165 RepID=UPI000B92EE26|nr:pectate lyase [Ralstonia pseudosolanacearum]MCD9230001.1 pectate lyase [Ralstonia pseudosolanacearum]
MSIQIDRPNNHFQTPSTGNHDAGSNIDSSQLQRAVQLLDQVLQQLKASKLFGNMLNQPGADNAGQNHAGGHGGGHHGGSNGFGANGRFGSPHANSPAQSDLELPTNKHNNGKHNTSASTPGTQTAPSSTSPTTGTSPTPTSTSATEGKVAYGVKPPEPTGVVDVSKPIVVKAGETFDGGGKYYRPTKAMGDGSQGEHQQAVFILEPGAKLKNVQYSGADGIHLLGDAKLDRVVNRQVGEDAITIDGPKNRAHDAKIAGIDPNSISNRPANVEITNSAFYGGKDKIIQDNGAANVKLDGVYVNGAGKVFRTNGGDTQMNTNVDIRNSTFLNVAEAVFRSDSKNSSVSFSNVNSDAPDDALVPDASQSTGTNKVSYKAYSG